MKNAIKLFSPFFFFSFFLFLILLKPIPVLTAEDFILDAFSSDATIESSGFANPENIKIQQDNNSIVKNADVATMKITFITPITSTKNIYYFQPRFYYASAGGDAGGVTCHYTVNTNEGDFSNTECGFTPDGYPDGYSDNAFQIDLPNNVHQINSFEFTIDSSQNPNFLLGIEYMEFFYLASDHYKPAAYTTGPFNVAKGQVVTLNGGVIDNPENTPIEYFWLLNNDFLPRDKTPLFLQMALLPEPIH